MNKRRRYKAKYRRRLNRLVQMEWRTIQRYCAQREAPHA